MSVDYNSILKKEQENTNAPATKEKRACSPGSGDEMTSPKKMKLLEYLADISPTKNNLSPADSLTSPGSCEKRTDESSDSPSTPRQKLKDRRIGGTAGHADAVLDLQRTLQKNYKMLKEKMEPTEIAEKFLERGILDHKAMENIQKGNDRRIKNDILIKELCRVKQENRENVSYSMFLTFLKETGQGNLVTELEDSQGKSETLNLLQNEWHDLQFIDEMKETLLEEVEPRLFIDEILTTGGISVKEHEDITTKPKRRQRIQSLLEKVKSAKSSVAKNIIKHMTDAYPDIYKAFKSERTGIKSKQQKRAVKHRNLVSAGSPMQLSFRITTGNNLAVQDSNEHDDPMSSTRKKRQEAEQIERRIVNNLNENPEHLAQLLDNCIADFKKVKFSCIKIYLKALSKKSLGKLMMYSRSGAAKQLLLSLIDDDTKKKLIDMNAKIVLEISKGCKDNVTATFKNECMCHLNKETVTRNFTALMEGMRGSRNIIKRFLQSHLLDDTTVTTLKEIQTVQKIEERNDQLLQFLLQNDFPDVFFCILEEEIVKHGGTNIIRATIKDLTDHPYSLTKADIRNSQEFLEEELEARWFIRRLEKKKDQDTEELLDIILNSESRDQRIGPFLEYLLRENDLAWFSDELRIRNKYIFDTLVSRKVSGKTAAVGSLDFDRIQTATHFFFDDIIEEVDPLILTKRLGEEAQQELHISKLKNVPERSKRASKYCMSLLGVSQSTFYDALNVMTACGYKDIVDNITALAREGPLNGRYMCPKVICIEQSNEKSVFKETFTLDDNSTEDASIPSKSAERNTEIISHIIIDDSDDNSDTEDDCTIVQTEINQLPSRKVDKSRANDCSFSPPLHIKLSRKSRVQSLKGGSESGIFSGSGVCTEGINTDEDSDYEDRSSEIDKSKMITEWIASHPKSESFGFPTVGRSVYTALSQMDETRSILHEEKGNLKQKQTEEFIAPLEHKWEMYRSILK